MSKNAKFEKWCEDEGLDDYVYRDGNYAAETNQAYEAWKDGVKNAIQSLEVTPELVRLALYEMGGESAFQPGYGGYVGTDSMTAALTAVFNAIKEQSK